MSTEIKCTIRHPVPDLPYKEITKAILGPSYELSLVICGDKLARAINIKHRQKSYKPNVLSFPYSKTEGEIFLNVPCAEREAHKYGVRLKARMALLFIHGCFHLAGHKHGSKMEALEQKMLKKYGL
jgi:probable rRNA maturation factor